MPPELVLLVFLPPLLHWESVCAKERVSRRGCLDFQMALG